MAGHSLTIISRGTVALPLKWYEFNQNNSGGRFIVNESVGHYVFVQATSAQEASEIAKSNGVYFNGCDEGYDCSCCGDRWHEPWNDEGSDDLPKAYHWKHGMVEWAIMDKMPNMGEDWWNGDKLAVIYNYDGTRQYGIPQLPDNETLPAVTE